MRQLTLRVDDGLAEQLKQAAAEAERSVNSYTSAVLRAAVDPELETDEAQRLRARLARAGLLADSARRPPGRPDAALLDAARKRAGRGHSLSDLVTESRR